MDFRILPMYDDKIIFLKVGNKIDLIGGFSSTLEKAVEFSLKESDLNFSDENSCHLEFILGEKTFVYSTTYKFLDDLSFNYVKGENLVSMTKEKFYEHTTDDDELTDLASLIKNARKL